MNGISRGIRNAFRNIIRTFSLVVILGLSIGLSLTMLIAHQAVSDKITSVKSAIGNTVSIAPAGFNGFSQVNNALTTTELSKVAALPHVARLTEMVTDRLTTIGSAQPSFFGGGTQAPSNTNNTTSLTSPITINTGGGGGGGGERFFISGGGSLPTNFTPPISVVGTNDPGSVDGTALTITSGATIDSTKDSNNALISGAMASKNNLKTGSTFTAYGATLTVAGIFTSSTQAANGTVILSLPTLQRLSGQSGVVTSAVATIDSLDNLSSATTAIKNTLGTSTADVTSAQEQADQTVQPLNSVKNVSLYSLIGAVIAGGVIILLTMIMIVRERRREIGVIKAIGASNLNVMFQFMVEAVTLTLLAAVVGIVLGVVAGNPITHLLVTNSSTSTSASASGGPGGVGVVRTGGGGGGFRAFGGAAGRGFGTFRNNLSGIHAAIGWSIILDGLVAALVIAIIGSSIASFFIAKIRPAEVMRVE
jgi:putative ABC transport system permease protein